MGPTWDVCALGCVCWDLLGTVADYPELDEKAPLGEFAQQGGGRAGTAAAAVAALGGKVTIFGHLADDEFGRRRLQLLDEALLLLDARLQLPDESLLLQDYVNQCCLGELLELWASHGYASWAHACCDGSFSYVKTGERRRAFEIFLTICTGGGYYGVIPRHNVNSCESVNL